jgi:hypothetical protein
MTTWRKWFVRGLTLAIVMSVGSGVYVYERFTNPDEMRRKVLAGLGEAFAGATVKLDGAHLRLLGGISVTELRLARRDDPDEAEFLHVPAAILYHDKENLLDGGEFRVVKMELQRPRIRLIRATDGSWNMANVLGPAKLDSPVPTLVITQGTLILEDHRLGEGAPPLEIKDVNLTMVNDPVSTLTINGSGSCDVLGEVQVTGSIRRSTNEISLKFEAASIPVGPALIQRLYPFAPDLVVHARMLQGTGKLQAQIHYLPGSDPAISEDIHFQLTRGKFSHGLLPVPLDNIEASVRFNNGQVTLERCTARSGNMTVKLTFKELLVGGDRRWEERFRELDAKIEQLNLTKEIMEKANLGKVWDDFTPEGQVNLTVSIRRGKDGWRKNCIVEPLSINALPKAFPFPVEQISGVIEHQAGAGMTDECRFNLAGVGAGRPVYLRGTVKGVAPDHEVDLSIWGDNIEMSKQLVTALPARYQDLARSFKATGHGDFQTHLVRDAKSKTYSNRHLIQLHDCTMCYAKFPYPLENTSATLDLLPDHWEVRDFHGEHKGGVFTARGGSFPDKESDRIVLQIEGKHVELDSEMEHALLNKALRDSYATFEPRGKLDFACTVSFDVQKPGSDAVAVEPVPDVDITMWPQRCSIKPQFFPYALHDVQGKVRFANRWVTIDDFHACNGNTQWKVTRGYTYLKPEGGTYSILNGLEANPLVPDPEFLAALPESLRKGWDALNIQDPIGFRTTLVVDTRPTHPRPDVYWDGVCSFRDARLRTGVQLEHVTGDIACRGRHNGDQIDGIVGNIHFTQANVLGQPLHEITSPFLVTRDAPDVLRFHNLKMQYCGGSIYGPVKVELGSTVRYELNLAGSEIRLEDFGRQNLGEHSQISGLAQGTLYLTGRGTDIDTLKGSGRIRVPEGKMYNLPLALDLLKVLGLRVPDRTAFEEADAEFDIQGKRLQFKELKLMGNAISLRGKGDMNLDGTDIDLDFNADWGRLHDVLPPEVMRLPEALSNQLLKVHMRGDLGNVHCTKDILPPVTGPLRRVMTDGSR